MLIVDSSSPEIESTDLEGYEQIARFFVEQGFIDDVRNHSALERSGLVFAEDFAGPALEALYSSLRERIHFYSVP